MKIVIPMAGRGSRYSDSGYELPKPLIEVAGKPMLLRALDHLTELDFSTLIIVLLEEHELRFRVSELVKKHLPETLRDKLQIVAIPDVTEGQLCTVLAAKELIDNEEDVLIAASDTYIKSNLGEDIRSKPADCAGIISIIDLPGEQWSFAKTDEQGNVIEVAEKVRISDHASNGLYYFSSGAELVSFGSEMIRSGERTRGEYYVIPVYQKMIAAGKRVLLSQADEMWDMGTPEAKAAFEAHLQRT